MEIVGTVVTLQDRAIPAVQSAEKTSRRVPVREFLLFPWGQIDTAYGPLTFDRDGASELLRRYESCTRNREGWLDIDVAHLSQTDVAAVEAHESAGRFRVQLRDDGLWVTDLTYRPDIYERVAEERLKYYSPVINFDQQNRIVELLQLGLTNIPAMHTAQPLALSISAQQSWPVDEESAWDKDAADKRVRKYCGSEDGSLEGVSLPRYQKFWAYVDDPEKPSTWKGLVGDVRDGKPVIVKRAVEALAAVIQGARGGIDVPADEMPKLRALVEKYYRRWGGTAPWSEKGKSMKFNRTVLLSLALSALSETPAMLEDKPGMMGLLKGLMEKLNDKLPGCHLEDVYEDHAVVGIPSAEAGVARETYMRVPYSVSGDKVELGEPIKVVKKWEPMGSVGDDVEKMERMSARLAETERMLLAATGKQSIAGAIGEVERLRSAEREGKALSARLEKLEARNFDAEKAVLLSDAKSAGKWTAKLEALALANADRAKRLGDDPITAIRETFDAAPVIVAPGQVQQPEVVEQGGSVSLSLTAEDKKIIEETSRMLGIDPKKYEVNYLANKARFIRN